MLTAIGRKAPPEDTVGLLLDCHERIRAFLALARKLAAAEPGEGGEIAEAAARVRRYFTEALPLHARDEDESIVPRLRGREPELDAALADMSREHLEHEGPLSALVAACAVLERDPGRHAEQAPRVSDAAAALEAHFVGHLAREETVIFPAMRRLLDAEADAAIVRELRARRGAPPAAAPPAATGAVRVRDSARREWIVEPRRDPARGRVVVLSPAHGDLEPFRASADGHRPDTHVRITGDEWALLARLAGASPGDAGGGSARLEDEAFRLVDRIVREAQHRLLMGEGEEDDDEG